jgi:SAM-dependent methyltransferase
MDNKAFESYVGVDISEAALAKAVKRSREKGRGDKTRFECSDFFRYNSRGHFDVVLFRESMSNVSIPKIRPI